MPNKYVYYSRYVAGSLIFGVLYDKLNKLLMFAAITFGLAVSDAARPWCSLFPAMLVMQCLGGVFRGGLCAGTKV